MIYAKGALTVAEPTNYMLELGILWGHESGLEGSALEALDVREVRELRDALTEWLQRLGRADG